MTPLQVQFSRALCNIVADWSKMKTCGTRLLSELNFLGFLGYSSGLRKDVFQIFARKTDGMTSNCEAYDDLLVLM